MPTEKGRAPWTPKAFRPESIPTHAELVDCLKALKVMASRSTYLLFEGLACKPPASRVAEAVHYTIECMESNPLLSSVLHQALTIEQHASFREVVVLPLTQRQRVTAEQLLCLREREICASFFRRAFRVLDESREEYVREFEVDMELP